MSRPAKVAFNSIALYVNMIVTMGVSLLATRYVLQAMGKETYGVYAVVANVVALFSFLNVAMAAATQRFISYSLGQRDGREAEIFHESCFIHRCIAAVLAFAVLVGGTWGIACLLDIPDALKGSTYVVLVCMVAGLVATIVAVPYESALNAYEDIHVIALVNIVEAFLKLAAAVAILYVAGHRLEIYAVGILCAQTCSYLLKRQQCRSRYTLCVPRTHTPRDKQLVGKMLAFAGWNTMGHGCAIARYQGTAILLNVYWGVAVNAAYGVAQQVNGFLLFFSNSIIRPLRPVLIKSEGEGNHDKMIQLTFSTCRITFLMLSVAVVPIFINTPYILGLWLTSVPPHTAAFCRYFLLTTLLLQVSIGLHVALESVGRIKKLQSIVGGMHLLSIPVGLICFQLGYPPESIFVVILAEEVIALFVRAKIAQHDVGMNLAAYLFKTAAPCLLCVGAAFALTASLCSYSPAGFLRLLLSAGVNACLTLALAFLFCFTSEEKKAIRSLFHSCNAKSRLNPNKIKP